MPFLLRDYPRLLATLRHAGFPPGTVGDFLSAARATRCFIRHDVDRRPAFAVRMAHCEAEAGVRSSYYFRCDRRGRFPVEACRRIAALGHETGYHYEDLARCGGDREAAIAAFRRNLTRLREVVPCRTVTMHGSPLSRHDNRELLDDEVLEQCELDGDISGAATRPGLVYFTDAGGKWNNPRWNWRDRIGFMPAGLDPLDSSALMAVLQPATVAAVGFNLHPERWVEGAVETLTSAAMDAAAAFAKGLLR